MKVELESLIHGARKAFAQRDFTQALVLLNRAGALAIENGMEDDVLVPLLRGIGDARCGLEDWTGAEAYYREALERMDRLGLADSLKAAGLLCNLGHLLDKQERFDESEPVYHRALAAGSRESGTDHPDLVPILNNMAYRSMATEDLGRAQALLEKSLAIVEAHVDPDHLALVEPLNNLGELYRRQGRAWEASELLLRALRILEAKVPDESHQDLVVLLRNAAAALRDAGEVEAAGVLVQRAKRIEEEK
jgi:tetratricopeptide (TPR) repeat protein